MVPPGPGASHRAPDKPLEIRLKSVEEQRQTTQRAREAEAGFLSKPAALALTGLAVASLRIPWLAAAPIAVLLADFVTFVRRRHAWLARANKGQPRLDTIEDLDRLADVYAAAGQAEPTMSDYEAAAGLTARPLGNVLRYKRAAEVYQGGTVVDIGCGDGRLCWRYNICPPESYIGVDPGATMIQTLRSKTGERGRGVVATAEVTTLPDACADLVVCSECFEHLTDPGVALREFTRILKPGGRIVIQSPSAYHMRNLNPFHIMTTWLGRLVPGVLQRTVVHEATFFHGFTYHWDFTHEDFARYTRGLPLTTESRTTAMYRFNPEGSLAHRLAYRIAQWPIINGLWWDMTVVLRKT